MLFELEKELDKGNGKYVLKTIQSIKIITETLEDDNINSDLEILKARAKQSSEDVSEAKELFESISKLYPKNIKSILCLAEIYLNEGDYDRNKELLKQAKKIDKNYWLFVIEKLIRKLRLNQSIKTTKIDENDFPKNEKQRSIYYRIYSHFYQKEKNYTKADEFIEKSIKLYPYSFSSFNTKLSFSLERLVEKGFPLKHIEKADEILNQINKIDKENSNWDDLYIGNKTILEFRKFYIYVVQQNYKKIIYTGKKLVDLIMQCSFDLDVDNFLNLLLTHYRPEKEDFERIIKYLSDKNISYELAKSLAFQFCERGKLLTVGKKFLSTKNDKIKDLILHIKEGRENEVIDFLKKDLQLMLTFANCLKDNSSLRKNIIDSMPDDDNIQKEKIYLLYYSDIEEYNNAFKIVQNIEFENANYLDCEISLKVVREKQVWEMEVKILDRLFKLEKNKRKQLTYKLDQFTACMKMEDYLEVINIGKYLLSKPKTFELMDKKIKNYC